MARVIASESIARSIRDRTTVHTIGELDVPHKLCLHAPRHIASRPVIFCSHVEVAGVLFSYLIALGLGFVALLPWLTLAIVALVGGYNVSKCPRCRSLRIRPSALKFGDKILNPTHIKPFRCEWCHKRFYAMTRKKVVFPRSPSLSG